MSAMEQTAEERRKADARRVAMDAAGCDTFRIEAPPLMRPSILCLCCGNRSYHPIDVEERFCAFCDWFHGAGSSPALGREEGAACEKLT